MQRTDFHFELPPDLIARHPPAERSAARMLLLDRARGAVQDRQFRDLPSLLRADDLLVFNDTRVVPARVHGVKESGGRIEILLERALDSTTALVHARASKGLKPAARVILPGGASACMLGREGELFRLRFSCDVLEYFAAHGEVPLPAYLGRAPEDADRERYQTIYAREPGAVAAPTAGLHFDADTFAALGARGIRHAFVTLHVGAGTFQPVRVDELEEHVMHEETLEVPAATIHAISAARAAGGRVIAVGTTVVRSLETAALAAAAGGARPAQWAGREAAGPLAGREAAGPLAGREAAGLLAGREAAGPLAPYRGTTRLFITPGYTFRVVDAMLTNFHLPESTLLMLCAAFAGREALLSAYAHAVQARYRFFSYGDAMLLT